MKHQLLFKFFLYKIFKKFQFILIIPIALISLASCGSTCNVCDGCADKCNSDTIWNVALNSPVINECSGEEVTSIKSDIRPQYIPIGIEIKNCGDDIPDIYDTTKGIVRLCGFGCSGEGYVEYRIPMGNIYEITTTTDVKEPPKKWGVNKPDVCCKRVRSGWFIFKKLELRAMTGYRGSQNGITYPTASGSKYYEASFINFDRGGSDMIMGFEIGAYFGFLTFDLFGMRDALQFGVMSGLWPMDGSTFIPLSFHPRITFNQRPNPFSYPCSTWYIFGDAGLPFDFETNAESPGDRYFWGLGLGYEFPIGACSDLSFDLGVRQRNLPLPEIDCCPDLEGSIDRNPFRKSTDIFLRFGITF